MLFFPSFEPPRTLCQLNVERIHWFTEFNIKNLFNAGVLIPHTCRYILRSRNNDDSENEKKRKKKTKNGEICLSSGNVGIISEVNKFFAYIWNEAANINANAGSHKKKNLNVRIASVGSCVRSKRDRLFFILRIYFFFVRSFNRSFASLTHTHTRTLDSTRHSLERPDANGNPFSCDSICCSHIQDASRQP